MSGYGFTSAGTTYDNEDLCISSSLPPPASSLLNDIDANGTADVNFQYDALGRRVARTGTGGSAVYVQMDQQTIAEDSRCCGFGAQHVVYLKSLRVHRIHAVRTFAQELVL
jgi:YD repeat-containing protein